MRSPRLFLIAGISIASLVFAQDLLNSQPPLWSTKPDVSAFEKTENEHLAAAQRSIGVIGAIKGPHTIANTLVPYDE